MSPIEMLRIIESALGVLRAICPPEPGKGHHHCLLCDAMGLSPCPVSQAHIALYGAHSQAYALAAHSSPEVKEGE